MQIFNNQSNINFNGAFRIKPAEIKAQAEIPTLFTQGMQKFTNILEKDRIGMEYRICDNISWQHTGLKRL